MSSKKKVAVKKAAAAKAPAAAKKAAPIAAVSVSDRYATLLRQGFNRHQILSCWLEKLKAEDDNSASMQAVLTALFPMLPVPAAALTAPSVRAILAIPRQMHFVYVIWSGEDAQIMVEHDPLDSLVHADALWPDDDLVEEEEEEEEEHEGHGNREDEEDEVDNPEDEYVDPGEDIDCSWHRLTTTNREDFYEIAKVGMFSVDLDELEYEYSNDEHRLSLVANYNSTVARYRLRESDEKFKMPSASDILGELIRQLQRTGTRPHAITNKLIKVGIKDAQFRMFAIHPVLSRSNVTPCRTVALNLEKNLRVALRAYRPLHKNVVKGLGMKGTSDGPTEWILSSTKLTDAVSDLHKNKDGWITEADVTALKHSDANKHAREGLAEAEHSVDLDADLLIVWNEADGVESEVQIRWA